MTPYDAKLPSSTGVRPWPRGQFPEDNSSVGASVRPLFVGRMPGAQRRKSSQRNPAASGQPGAGKCQCGLRQRCRGSYEDAHRHCHKFRIGGGYRWQRHCIQ
jgi:hypothetical protein